MVDEFSTRLNQLLEYLNITPVRLAEQMGIQRTSFNHLLSGRNKPGFEFLNRLHTCYPSVDLNWLISGNGSITVGDNLRFSQPEKIMPEPAVEADLFSNIFIQPAKQEPVKQEHVKEPDPVPTASSVQGENEIDRLIIIYKTGKMVEIKH